MKKGKCKTPGYFTGGELAMVAQYAGNLANDYVSAANYQFDPSKDPYKVNFAKGITGGLAGIIPEIIKANKDKKARENYVPFATPGNYANGGPIKNEAPSQQDYRQISPYSKASKGNDSSGRKVWRKGMKEDGSGELTSMQTFLKNKGFYTGEVDGIYGAKTEKAVRDYQEWFNKNAKEEMFYTKDGTVTERIGGPKGKKIAVDGVVGDQTRTALMYREMPKQVAKAPKKEIVPEFPVGESTIKYSATDKTPTDFPDSPMNYQGRLEMLGWALLGAQASGVGMTAVEADLVGANAARNLTQQGIRGINTVKPPLNPNVPNPLQGIGGRSFAPKTPSSYGTRIGYSMGGEMDEQLSSRAFEVEADPNKIDSKLYPHLNARLDHEEVVMDNKFVFSNRLKNPQTGKSFADEAEKLQKSVGKSERVLKNNPKDAFANNTIAISNNRTSNLASTQETLATMLGHRDNKPKGMAYGGPTDPLPNQPYMKLGGDYYYDPYQSRFMWRNPITGGYSVENMPSGQNTYGSDVPRWKVQDGMITRNYKVSGGNYNDEQPYSIAEHLKKYPATTNSGDLSLTTTEDTPSMRTATQPPVRSNIDPLNPFGVNNVPVPVLAGGKKKGSGKPAAVRSSSPPTTSPLDGQSDYDRAMYEEMQKAANNNLPPFRSGYSTPTSVASTTERGLPDIASATNFGTQTGVSMGEDKLFNKFTIGDALQAVEVASKFGQLIGGPDKETPNFDTTRITKESYDPTNALYQTNRTLQNARNTIDAPSINARRSISNSLYAQRLGQVNNILSEYNRMNQGATTQYEQRVADQRRYNIGQTNYTEDLNQRNLDTFRNATQNAFTSLGNFGEGLNAKQQSTDALQILKKSYPQVYRRIMESWLQEQEAKPTKS